MSDNNKNQSVMDDDQAVMQTSEELTPQTSEVTETTEQKPESTPNVDISKSIQNTSSTEIVDDRGRTTKVEVTPPKSVEVKKDKSKLSDFDKIIEGGLEKILPKEKVETKPEVKPEVKTEAEVPKSKVETDLTGFGEQQQIWLRRMPSDAREHFAAKLREERDLKENVNKLNERVKQLTAGKEILPESYFEHPRSYELTEEYSNNQKNINTSISIYNHWYQQKLRVEAGEDWEGLEDEYDAKGNATGNILKQDPQQTTPEAKTYIDEQLAAARNQIQSFQAKARNIAEVYKQNHDQLVGSIKDLSQKHYPQFEDKEYEGNKILEQTMAELPKLGINKSNVLFDLLSRSVAMNYIYANYIKNNLKKVQTQQKLKEESSKAGPNSSSFSGGSSGGGNTKKVSLSDYNKLLS